MSNGPLLIFGVFVSVVFMAIGILGIHKKRKFSKSIQSMYKVAGVLVDTTVCQQHDDDNIIQDIHFPVYEYEWQGVKKRLYSTTNALHIKIGRPVHILIDPQTEEAICLEEQKASDSMLLIFGVIGLLTLILMILLGTGILS